MSCEPNAKQVPSHDVPLRCSARTHGELIDGHILKLRCRDRGCCDVQAAQTRGRGERVHHCWDLWNPDHMWTTFEMDE